MDVLCEHSLFNKRRRVGSGRAHICPYARVAHYREPETEGLLLPKLHWNIDESIQQTSGMVVEDTQKLEELHEETEQIQEEQQTSEQISDPHSMEIEVDETALDTREDVRVDQDKKPDKNHSIGQSMEGLVPTTIGNRYHCFYCQQAAERNPGRRALGSALSHRSVCLHNPNRVQRYSIIRAESSHSSISRNPVTATPPTASPTSPKSPDCWIVLKPRTYGCRACMDNREVMKTWKTPGHVLIHFRTQCKYGVPMKFELPYGRQHDLKNSKSQTDQQRDKKPEIIVIDESTDESMDETKSSEDNESEQEDFDDEESNEEKMRPESSESEDSESESSDSEDSNSDNSGSERMELEETNSRNSPSILGHSLDPPTTKKTQNQPSNIPKVDTTCCWIRLAATKWVCRACYKNKMPLETWISQTYVRDHWITCKFNKIGGEVPVPTPVLEVTARILTKHMSSEGRIVLSKVEFANR
jgi:hypothetical protein